MTDHTATFFQVLGRGLRQRCPRCGRGSLYEKWYTLHARCPACGLVLEPSGGDTWGFMYASTACLTGLIIIAMLVIRPPSAVLGALALLGVALALVFGTLPRRKAVAIALDYLTRRDLEAEPAATVDHAAPAEPQTPGRPGRGPGDRPSGPRSGP